MNVPGKLLRKLCAVREIRVPVPVPPSNRIAKYLRQYRTIQVLGFDLSVPNKAL